MRDIIDKIGITIMLISAAAVFSSVALRSTVGIIASLAGVCIGAIFIVWSK